MTDILNGWFEEPFPVKSVHYHLQFNVSRQGFSFDVKFAYNEMH